MAFKHYKHLNVPDSWERYFTKYPQGMSILEALFEWVSQVDSMVDNQNNLNDNVEQFRNEIDAFIGRFDTRLQDEVTHTLKDWQKSGFLDIVISSALQWQLDGYITTNEQDKLSLNTQLTQKTTKGEIGLTDFNKNITQFDETWISDSLRAMIAGTASINATPAEKSVTTSMMADKAVTPLILNTRNKEKLFGESRITFEQGSISSTTGGETESDDRIRSKEFYSTKNAFVELVDTESIQYLVAHYDDNLQFIETTFWKRASYYEPEHNGYYRIVVNNLDGSNISPSDNPNIKTYAPEGISKFEYGSIASLTGELTQSNGRMRSREIEFVPKNTLITLDNTEQFQFGVYFYTPTGEYINGTSFINTGFYIVPTDSYAKIVLAKTDLTNMIALYDKALNSLHVHTNGVGYLKQVQSEALSDNKVYPLTSYYWSDFVFVNDKLVAFGPSDYDGLDENVGAIYIFNEDMQLEKRLKHNFGHVNSISYNEAKDALVFGNGSGTYGTDGQIHVIVDVTRLLNAPEDTMRLLDEWALTINVGRNFGDKLNAIWAHDNNGQNDLVYTISDDGATFNLLQLGINANNLTKGTFIGGKTGGAFNGTYNIIQSWATESVEVIQGATYHNGFIYAGVGHDGLWIVKYNLSGDTVEKEERKQNFYLNTGVKFACASEGVSVKNDVIYHGIIGGLTQIRTYPLY